MTLKAKCKVYNIFPSNEQTLHNKIQHPIPVLHLIDVHVHVPCL